MLEGERGLEPLDVALVVQQEEVAVLAEVDPVHPFELVERAERDADVQLVRELRSEAARRLARRARGERVALEQDHAVDAELAQVPRDRGAHHAAADHDDLRGFH